MKERNLSATPLPGEDVLADDYPVHNSYLYLTPDGVRSSMVRGTVATLKKDLNITEVRRCDMAARNLF